MMKMVEVKVSELEGAALDWAVAMSEGMPLCGRDAIQIDYILVGTGHGDLKPFSPSTEWSQG
ncbi:phage protein NinX family protein, partial [Enterococcus faecium]